MVKLDNSRGHPYFSGMDAPPFFDCKNKEICSECIQELSDIYTYSYNLNAQNKIIY